MRFVFHERRAAQAAAYLLQLHGGTMNYMVLIKLMYYADREALIRTGQPITGDRMLCMNYGPVLSAILDFMHMGRPEGVSPWFEYVSDPHDYSVSSVRQSPETDELSRYEIGVLDDVHQKYGAMDRWALVRLTHELPEGCNPAGSCLTIEPETILRAAGKPQHEIERIVEDAEDLWFMSKLCSSRTD